MNIIKKVVDRLLRLRKINFLRNMILITAVVVVVIPAINILFVYPAFTDLLIKSTENEALQLAGHLQQDHLTITDQITTNSFDEDFESQILDFQKSFNIIKIKVFTNSGEIIYSTDEEDIGQINENDYFYNIVANGEQYSKVVRKNNETAEGKLVVQDVVETYVPIQVNAGEFIGAFELYYDITDKITRVSTLKNRSSITTAAIGVIMLAIIFTLSSRMIANEERIRQLSQAVKQNPNGIIIVNMDGVVLFANEKAAYMTGYSATKMMDRPLEDYLTCSQETQTAILEAIHSGAHWQQECYNKTKTNDGSWEHISISPVSTPTGEVEHILVTRQDINERKSAEEEVQRQKQFFESLVRNSPIAIVTLEMNGRISACNPAFEQLFNYTHDEIINQFIDDLIAPDDHLQEAAAYTKNVNEGNIIQVITKRRRKDGELVDVEVFGVPVVVNNKQIGILGLYHDITDHIKSQTALETAKNAAEAANKTKSEFLSNMSHEIRTPLNGIIGMTGLLLDTPLSDEQKEFSQAIHSSGDTLLTIINDILDFSKIEAGRLDLEEQPFDLGKCVEEALDLLAPTAFKKNLELAYLIDHKVPNVMIGDVTRLRQILVNLIGNAVKFTAQGEVVVSVMGQILADDYYQLYFAIKDTGIGIPSDKIDRLFKSFSQVDASTTRKFGGTGLGLVISKRLTEMMGGSMWVDSIPGEGSTFHFSIRATAVADPRQSQKGTAMTGLAGKRLLIVDDNDTNRFILERQAQSWNMEVETVDSGLTALAWLKSGKQFDVAVIDMHMPEMDGLMLAEKIHQLAGTGLPMIMLTSLGQRLTDPRHKLLAAYLTKPTKPAQLQNVLANVLDKSIKLKPVVKTAVSSSFDNQMGKRNPLRVLLAEDNLINQKVALRMLERLGYRADVAANGQEALDALRRQPYDVVFMDVQMPEMDGVEASKRIRKEWPQEQQPQIIAMTAHALKGDREYYLDIGMDYYISKPVRLSDLISALKQCRLLGENGIVI